MQRRILSGVVAAVALSGCGLFQTPCEKVAAHVCGLPGEEATCTFLKGLQSGNELGQKACTRLEPAAAAYAADPTSLVAKLKWQASSAALGILGFAGERMVVRPSDKLEKARDEAAEALKNAGEAVTDAVKDAAKTP